MEDLPPIPPGPGAWADRKEAGMCGLSHLWVFSAVKSTGPQDPREEGKSGHSKSPRLDFKARPWERAGPENADSVFSPRELLTGGWRCLTRGPVREEKEAYSVPVIPGLCFCPFLLAQAVSYTRNSHSLGCCILWTTCPSLAWARAAGDEELPPKRLNRRVTSHSFPVSAYNTSSQILEVHRVRARAFNFHRSLVWRAGAGPVGSFYFLRDPINMPLLQCWSTLLGHSTKPRALEELRCVLREN